MLKKTLLLFLCISGTAHGAIMDATGALALPLSPSMVETTGGNTVRTLADHSADIINVKDFGAKGDGKTDDTAAIAAAISYSHTTPYDGGKIYFPDGIYNISSTILLTGSGFSLVGENPRSTTINATFSSGNIIQIGQAPDNLVNQNDQTTGTNKTVSGNISG